jgi:pantoate--beta-alanine ligase
MNTERISQPEVVTTVAVLRERLAAVRRRGQRIGVVPTMGALHEGHLSLVRTAQAECDFTVVTIFVNPTQFGPNEDFAKYPRTLEADLNALASCRTDLVFAPQPAEVYPAGCDSRVEVGAVAVPLEGQFRPGHFCGVATVVLKLFNMVGADVAFFGQKDYQQTRVIRRMVADLNVPTIVRVCSTVREPDGLAMSSRNRYLSSDARQRALSLWRSLCLADELIGKGQRCAATIAARMRDVLLAAGGSIDYAELVDPETLLPVAEITGPTLAVLAVKIDGTRLIDNRILEFQKGK